jgi:AcrR family transcriptional regulator
MTRSPGRRPRRKRAGQYHHGDLRRALVDEALRTIERDGVEGLTLRAVGESLAVSRTALYRHFSDKQALVAAVASEGFRTLRLALVEAWERGGRSQAGFQSMGEAYLRFAVTHPSHYRVMFGRFVESGVRDPDLVREADGAFQALVEALVARQLRVLPEPTPCAARRMRHHRRAWLYSPSRGIHNSPLRTKSSSTARQVCGPTPNRRTACEMLRRKPGISR